MSINLNEHVKKLTSLSDLNKLSKDIIKKYNPDDPKILICHGTGCLANGSMEVFNVIQEIISKNKIETKLIPEIKTTGCHGFCSRGPLVQIKPDNVFYQKVSSKDAIGIVEKTILKGKILEHLLYKDPKTNNLLKKVQDIPFYKQQNRMVLKNIGKIDPTDIMDSIAVGAYRALAKALEKMDSNAVIEEIKASGLRGRGGAGFPTGIKWDSAFKAAKKKRSPLYVVVNGDEGDPGAFMDRTIMEGDPHAVIEGLILGGYALDANIGYIYVREEYPLAIKHLRIAIQQAKELGLLGKNIFNTSFSFDIKISLGAGAFVCGESTALFSSIEGKAGMPRPKYIRSVEEGLWKKPTVLNNVETWANIPIIITNGSDWFSKIGSPNNTGTKVFSLVGKVNNVGLVEVPMGTSVEDIVEKIGGGLPDNEPFKAVQTGGPSGGCIPYSLKNTPVDFDSLANVGSMMGSGGMIVMDKDDCVVDISRYFLKFLEEESCGKCLPCRLGLKRLRNILDRFSCGKGNKDDIDDIKSMSEAIQDGSLCALGSSAPNPVLTTLKYFEDEYLLHIKEKKCPSGVCKDLITYFIDHKKCTGCGLCKKQCPQHCIEGDIKKPHTILTIKCIRCGICKEFCNFSAVNFK